MCQAASSMNSLSSSVASDGLNDSCSDSDNGCDKDRAFLGLYMSPADLPFLLQPVVCHHILGEASWQVIVVHVSYFWTSDCWPDDSIESTCLGRKCQELLLMNRCCQLVDVLCYQSVRLRSQLLENKIWLYWGIPVCPVDCVGLHWCEIHHHLSLRLSQIYNQS